MLRGSPKAAPQAVAPVPVTVAAATEQDVPVYLAGIGTVQAFNTVQIRAQVNGTLLALPVLEGQEVQKGDVVAEIDPAPYKAALDQALAQRAKDVALLQNAQLNLRRYKALEKDSFAAVQQVDNQQAVVNTEMAIIKADDAMIEMARINLGYCTIHAPVAGRVSLYKVDAGNLVMAGSQTSILSIDQDKPIAVVFTLPEDELLQVQDGGRNGSLRVQVFAAATQRLLATGTLMAPNNAIDTATGTIALKARFANKDDRLWPGQFVTVRLQVGTLAHALTVPALAVQHGPDGLYVFQVKPDHTVVQTAIEVASQDIGNSKLAVVTKGLTRGAEVVVSGQYRLVPGAGVTIISAPPPMGAAENTGGATPARA
ncbi:MAG TPA: efflux RND transporter periplasmic adaptor subunit [Acidocella sp.]|jgi:multidrug efflux system membrane fusion protein|nr:efflux RND transporter periplasmic adaptor subunit [Acidocella sp.]